MAEYESAPGWLFYKGKRFVCPCGNSDFKTEIGPVPHRFWCTCGEMHTEDSVIFSHEGEPLGDQITYVE